MRMFPTLVILLTLFGGTSCHSWIACTDYLEENGDFWSASLCRAYARDGKTFTLKNEFGVDKGYNYNNVPDNKPCITDRSDSTAYNDQYPMAVYYPGQKVVIAHPTKNHVAELCTNRYIPDNGNFIYRSEVNPSADPTLSAFKQNRVVDLGTAPFGHETTDEVLTFYPKPGKQNAPRFCDNPDKALATSAFYITPGLQSGRYTFLWSWGFNSDSSSDTYTSCWEADVVATKADRDAILTARSLSTADPALLHYISLAPVPDGVTTQTPPPTQDTTTQQQPSTQDTTTQQQPSTQDTTTQPTVAQTTTTTTGGVPSTLLCLDSCLKACY